jgi:hypothetical protein
MAYAATATHELAQGVAAPREFSASLRLQQGGSARATWLLTESPGGTMISVGADSACDWQIRAAFVPARAFSILVLNGRAFVRSGPEPGLLIDGKPVDDSWNPLPGQARIDIGLARFEVRTGYVESTAEEPVLELLRPRVRPTPSDDVQVGAWSQPVAVAQSAALKQTAVVHRQSGELRTPSALRTPGKRRRRILDTQDYGAGRGEHSRVQNVVSAPAQESQRVRTHQAWAEEAPARELQKPAPQAEEPSVAVPRVRAAQPRMEVPRVSAPLTPEPQLVTPAAPVAKALRGSTIELRSDDLDYVGTLPMQRGAVAAEYACSPSLLGSDEMTLVTAGMPLWRYFSMGAFFASAYGAWLYLLDRL